MSTPAETPAELPILVIEAGRGEGHYWRDLWRYRELLGFLAWRDVKVRYKQTALGILWALVQPAITLVVFSFVFGHLAGMPAGAAPYPLLVMSGLLPWQLFANALTSASGSVVGNTHLIAKVYFPRLVVPLAAMTVAMVDFLIVCVLYLVVCAYWGFWPDWHIVALPAFVLLGLLAALGAGLWLTSLTVRFRDFRFVVPFLLQAGVFISPVGFSTANFPSWGLWLSLNPMVGVINGFRWCLLRGAPPLSWPSLAIGLAVTLLLLASGLWYFRRTERGFADII